MSTTNGRGAPDGGSAYDVAVIGLGAIGSAAAAELAGRGSSVLGIDRFVPPHPMGSSHADTRMIREAYYQGAHYVPLAKAAYESWRALERETGRDLLRITRGLMIGRPDSHVFGGCLRSALEHGLEHEVLTAAQVRERFPPFHLGADAGAVLEPHAGVLDPEACLRLTLDQARDRGVDIRSGERVEGWRPDGSGVRLETDVGEYRAQRAIFAVGAWTGSLFADLDLPLEVERTIQFWFQPASAEAAADFEPARCPGWVWEYGPRTTWYGFPRTARGIKVGMHVEDGRVTHADRVRRDVTEAEVAAMRGVLERFMPDAAGPLADASVCMYTNTPDEAFILDRHPECSDVMIFGGGSGHAFKFARVLGGLLADLAMDRDPAYDLEPFRIGRFAVA